MYSDLCGCYRSHAITNIDSLLCFHYSLLGCDDVFRTISLLPGRWGVVLTVCSRVLEKLTGLQLVQKFSAFLELKVSLPYSQVPASFPYPEAVHTPIFHFLKIQINIILPSTPGSPKWSLSLRLRHQNPVYTSALPTRATCRVHPFLLHFTTQKILGEECRSLSSSLCSFLHSPATSSLP
jgi:hypothetical protein